MARKRVDEVTRRSEVPFLCPCAHQLCPTPAIVRLQTKTGWANVCELHYVAHFQAEAKLKFTAMGLDRWADESREDWRSRCAEYMKLIVKRRPVEQEEAA